MGAVGNLLVLALAFVVLGVVLVVVSLLCFSPQQRDSLGRLRATATVKGAEVAAREEAGKTVYAPVIQWEYEVGGVQYRVKGYDQSGATGSEGWAKGIAACYFPEMEVRISYEPHHPDRSVLETATESSPTICLGTFQILGLVALGIGVVLVLITAALHFGQH